MAATLLALAGCGSKEQADPPIDGADVADAAVDAAIPTDVTDPGDTPGADGVSADIGERIPPGANLKLSVTWSGGGGYLVSQLMPASPGSGSGGSKITETDHGFVDSFPRTLWLKVPAGVWWIGAQLLGTAGDHDTVIADDVYCKLGSVASLEVPPSGAGFVAVKLKLHTLAQAGGQICAPEGESVNSGLAIEKASIEPPATEAGGAHLLDAAVVGERLWIAGYQDGYVSFDFPAAGPLAKLAGWKAHGQFECGRITHLNGHLFCTGRTGVVGVLSLGSGGAITGFHETKLGEGLFAEGTAPRGDLLWVAVHNKGLRAMAASAPFALETFAQPDVLLKDAWDVEPLGKDHLLVGDGAHGLRVVQVIDGSAKPPKSLANLALPGVAAYLHATEEQVIVGGLGGGMHIVSLADPSKPLLQGTLAMEGMVFGVTSTAGLAVAAAGFHLAFVDMPPVSQAFQAPLNVRDVEPSYFFAMSAVPYDGGVLTAEFQAVRRFELDTDAKSGPLMLAPKAVFAGLAAVGQQIKAILRLHNPGTKVLKINEVRWSETGEGDGSDPIVAGPLSIPPGDELLVSIAVNKTIKGLINHGLTITSNDLSRPATVVQVLEVPHLRPGQSLPPLVYQNAQGQELDIAKHFEGKVGVLFVAAHSCPVAFDALLTASGDLAPLIAAGKVAAVAINPWDKPQDVPITGLFESSFPILYSPLTTDDGHDWSEVLDETLAQPQNIGAPMPVVYVVRKEGHIALAELGYRSQRVLSTIEALLTGN